MSAAPAEPPHRAHPRAWQTASPAAVRASLSAASAAEFDEQWRAVLSRAAESYDLSELVACLDAWRRVALVTAEAGGPEGYRSLMDDAAGRLRRRDPNPVARPWSDVRAELGL